LEKVPEAVFVTTLLAAFEVFFTAIKPGRTKLSSAYPQPGNRQQRITDLLGIA